MRQQKLKHVYRCLKCGFYSSDLPIKINHLQIIDESIREYALKPIRINNFNQILNECADLFPDRIRVLDVGCAHGWFLEAVTARGYLAVGLEPDETMASKARAAGHEVVMGFFPEDLAAEDQYDLITFHDVFEHLPKLDAVVETVYLRLNENGIVIINLPVSDGLIFRLARALTRLGYKSVLSRMWQVNLPSPHLSYFSAVTLQRLMVRHGFEPIRSGSLEAFLTKGLYNRIRYDRSVGAAKAAFLYTAARMLKLITGLFASDIQYFVFRKQPLPDRLANAMNGVREGVHLKRQ